MSINKAVAVIPARGGSKRIPRKNILPFCGKPAICYPIEAALESGLFQRVIVSTDDAEIAAVSRQHGADVVDRPAELADDHARLRDVMKHEAQHLCGLEEPSHACFLLATAVFVTAEILHVGAALMNEGRFDHALTVIPFPSPIQRAFVQTPGGGTRMFMPENYSMRSQDLEEAFHDAGQCYWGRLRCFLDADADYFNERTTLIPMDRRFVVDIDTPTDWEIAEARYRSIHERST
jgi:pseudaminic acid cytidylyltransferase